MLLLGLASIGVPTTGIFLVLNFLGPEFRAGVPTLVILAPAALLLASSQTDWAGCLALNDFGAIARVTTLGAGSH